jgi:hypothetical protein
VGSGPRLVRSEGSDIEWIGAEASHHVGFFPKDGRWREGSRRGCRVGVGDHEACVQSSSSSAHLFRPAVPRPRRGDGVGTGSDADEHASAADEYAGTDRDEHTDPTDEHAGTDCDEHTDPTDKHAGTDCDEHTDPTDKHAGTADSYEHAPSAYGDSDADQHVGADRHADSDEYAATPDAHADSGGAGHSM